jgi:uncharacterized DUF497 family protein
MEFDWDSHPSKPEGSLKPRDVEESFEDPFAVKLLPDTGPEGARARYFNLGLSSGGKGVFTIYRTNGKVIEIVLARPFGPEEKFFYERQQEKLLNQKL